MVISIGIHPAFASGNVGVVVTIAAKDLFLDLEVLSIMKSISLLGHEVEVETDDDDDDDALPKYAFLEHLKMLVVYWRDFNFRHLLFVGSLQ